MEESERNQIMLLAPRSFPILLLQVFGLCPLCTLILMLFTLIASGAHVTSKDILYISAICIPLLLTSFVMFYFPQKYRPRLMVDDNKGVLKKSKKGQPAETYDINSIKSLTSKRIFTLPGGQYKLILEKHDDSSDVLFHEDTPYKGGHWELFSERVAGAVNRPLEKEIWQEDYDGKLSLISREELLRRKKGGLLILAVPLAVSLLGSIGYRLIDTARAFVLIGAITVLANMCMSFLFAFRNRDSFGKWGDHSVIIIGGVLTLFIPYSIFYVLFVFVLTGFQLPFNF